MPVNKEKQYFEEHAWHSIAFYPWQLYGKFHNIMKNKKMFMALTAMSADNREYLKQELGKQHFITYDSGNRKLHCYRVEFNNGTLWILTARERGTSYEYVVSGDEKKLRKEIKKYLEKLYKNREQKTF